MRNLLIGNGINLTNHVENSFLCVNNVYDRFIKKLGEYWQIINELVYQNEMNLDELINILNFTSNKGIENITGIVFEFVYEKIQIDRHFTKNDSYRLIEILGEIAIKSLFFQNDRFCIPKITDNYVNVIVAKYKNIFTLNYIEEWDKVEIVKYLHGNLMKYINSYSDIGSNVLSFNKEYCNFKKSEYIKIDFKDIIFMPINDIVTKHNYIADGLEIGDDLYLADDLLLYDGRELYNEFDKLDNIDVFGMSPYGDVDIIKKIKNIKDKNIYVYKLNNDEINEWKKHGIDNCFIDSSLFLNM